MMVITLIFFILFTNADGKYNIFTNNSVQLDFNEIAFFESPGFPQLHNSTEVYQYNSTFFTNDTSINSTRCVFILQGLSYSPAPYKMIQDVFIFNASTFYLEVYRYIPFSYQALKGYVFFENWDNSCMFESLSRETPFKFENEEQIILIQSVLKNKTNFGDITATPQRENNCKWQFIAPEGYGIKILIQTYNVSDATEFRILNSSEILQNERSVQINHPYYFEDLYQWFQITLSEDNHTANTNIEFSAIISVVKKHLKKADGNCIITETEKNMTWSTNLSRGYENNIFCNYEVIVKQNTTILGTVVQCSLETFVDNLIYFDEEYTYLLSLNYQFLLLPHLNGSEKKYSFQFVSDGSLQSSGFMINYEINACHCADPYILCNNLTYSVMKDSTYVCPKMLCNFTIVPCQSEYSNLIIISTNYTNIDYIKVISNGIVIYNSVLASFGSDGEERLYLKSEGKNIIEVSSVSRGQKKTTFSLKPFEVPPVKINVTLTEEGYSYVLDEAATDFALVRVDDEMILKGVSIEVYGKNYADCKKNFFKNNSLTEKIVFEDCDITNYFYKCKSHSREIAYFYNAYPVRCFIAFSLTSNTNNCLYPSTVYFVRGDRSSVSVLSSHQGKCKITVLKEEDTHYSISNIFTTAYDENVEVYFGLNQEKKFLEFNNKTSSTWTGIKFMAEIYSIKVPKGAVVLLTLVSAKLPIYEQIKAPYSSFFTNPHYGMKKCVGFASDAFITFKFENIKTRFTVLGITSANNAYLLVNNERIRIKSVGEMFVFKNLTVAIHFEQSSEEYCKFFMAVETI